MLKKSLLKKLPFLLPALCVAVAAYGAFVTDEELVGDFADGGDYELAQEGLLRKPTEKQILNDDGSVAWDFHSHDFLSDKPPAKSIHPSLLRQAKLNNNHGLFEVVPGIYQVRGFDVSNITFVRSQNGWIVLDTLTVPAVARAAKKLLDEQFGELPIVAVVYSHSHADHFGGAAGIISAEAAASGKVKVVAPEGFFEEAISENVMAGDAMSRRTNYMYGTVLEPGPEGQVDVGLCNALASGPISLIRPNTTISKPLEEMEIDGVKFIFQNTPNTEAPAEMNAFMPDFKALWMAENCNCTMHNVYTLRGAKVRDAHKWSKYLNDALYLFGQDAEVMFGSHGWPRRGNTGLRDVLKDQRDLYAYIHNQALFLANRGITINEIHNEFKAPESLMKHWYNRGYYGSLSHNSRAVVNRYLGFFDMVPASLNKLSPAESGKKYIEYMGGSQAVMDKVGKDVAAGNLRWAAEILNLLVFAEPDNAAAKVMLADIYEKLGFACENATWRNIYLVGAKELRHGITADTPSTVSPDIVSQMEPEMLLDFIAINLDAARAEGKEFIINFSAGGKNYVSELRNCVLTNAAGFKNDDARLNVNADSTTELIELLTMPEKLDDLQKTGKIELDGDDSLLKELFSLIDVNKNKNFPIVTP